MRWVLPVLAGLFLAGCDMEDFGPSDRFKADFHYTLKPSDRLSVENQNGEIEIAGWDEPSIEVTGVKYAATEEMLKSVRIDIHEAPPLAEIRTVRTNSRFGNSGTRYLIRAPRKTLIDRAVSSNGAIRIHDMASAVRIHTSNGAIHADNISAGLDAETSNGAIELRDITGKLNLHTSNGHIQADDITGQCEASTSNGPVTLRFKGTPGGPTRITTSNGSVDVSMARPPKDGIRADTSNGSITLHMPADLAARLDARTSPSSVTSEFDVATTSDSDEKKHHLAGNIGGGGPLIDLSTRNGGIHLRKASATVN